jgi:hypothetical protein
MITSTSNYVLVYAQTTEDDGWTDGSKNNDDDHDYSMDSTCGPPICARPLEELSPEELEQELDNSNRDYLECDGSYQDYVTDDGYFCDAGSSSHQCEMDESQDKTDNGWNHSCRDGGITTVKMVRLMIEHTIIVEMKQLETKHI